ncbi:hypothetical protein MLPF_0539 [Mycobacterium lepromatosis]|nr:hypothetical protein MLPF_0539 [Mycobacterium lepromatosis]
MYYNLRNFDFIATMISGGVQRKDSEHFRTRFGMRLLI